MSSENAEREVLASKLAGAAAAGETDAIELLRLLQMQRLFGDPRVRVQVPTDGDRGEYQQPCMSRRYSLEA